MICTLCVALFFVFVLVFVCFSFALVASVAFDFLCFFVGFLVFPFFSPPSELDQSARGSGG